MLNQVLVTVCCVALAGCERPAATPIPGPTSPQNLPQGHSFAVYGANGQTFLLDGKTGDAWVFDSSKRVFQAVKVEQTAVSPEDPLGILNESVNPREGTIKSNASGDKVIFHDRSWRLVSEVMPDNAPEGATVSVEGGWMQMEHGTWTKHAYPAYFHPVLR